MNKDTRAKHDQRVSQKTRRGLPPVERQQREEDLEAQGKRKKGQYGNGYFGQHSGRQAVLLARRSCLKTAKTNAPERSAKTRQESTGYLNLDSGLDTLSREMNAKMVREGRNTQSLRATPHSCF